MFVQLRNQKLESHRVKSQEFNRNVDLAAAVFSHSARESNSSKILVRAGGKRRIYSPHFSSCQHTHSHKNVENISLKLPILKRLKQFACREKALLGDRCCSSFSAILSRNTKIFGTKHPIKEMPSLTADGTSHPNLEQPANVRWNLIANTARAFFPDEQALHNFSLLLFQFVNKHHRYEQTAWLQCYQMNPFCSPNPSSTWKYQQNSLFPTPPLYHLCKTPSFKLLILSRATREPWKNPT